LPVKPEEKVLIPKASAEFEKGSCPHRWEPSGTELNPAEKERLAYTLAAVPPDTRSTLDLGCGDGRLSNLLHRERPAFLVSLDLNLPALRGLTSIGCCASAQSLPFADRAFDLVLAAETIEHLPQPIYAAALQEMARVAQKYILITVPNREDLNENTAVCADCGARFHIWGHQRSYRLRRLGNLFPGFRMACASAFGARVVAYNRFILWVRRHGAGACCWEDRTACFACGSARRPEPRWPLLARACDYLNNRCWGRFFQSESWLLALFKREF
jgi:SAM-dependent methyltransferase